MQLSLFDEINEYKGIAIVIPGVTWRPSKMKFPYLIGRADIFYFKGDPLFQLELSGDPLRFWSMTGKSCTGICADNVENTLNNNIEKYIKKGE